jgi:hypothetical protein
VGEVDGFLIASMVGVALVALTTGVVRMRSRVTVLETALRDHASLDHDHGAGHHADDHAGHDEDEWPEGFADPGLPVPPEFASVASGAWTLLVFLSPDCDRCTVVASGLASVVRQLADYRVAVVRTGPIDVASSVELAVDLDDVRARLLPTPAVALVDPGGIVRGRGTVESAEDLVVFVADGDEHGYGPAHGQSSLHERPIGAPRG